MNKNDLTIVKIMDGLGNQMFQYVFSRALYANTKRKILLDIHDFERMQKTIVEGTNKNSRGITINKYYLDDVFKNLKADYATKDEVEYCLKEKSKYRGFIRKLFNIKKKSDRILEDCYCGFDEKYYRIAKKSERSYFEGYFQNEKYLDGIEDLIRHEFEFQEFDDEFNKNWQRKIENASNPVFIHIRRGDYLNLGWQLSDEYYKKALEIIKQKVENPTFFVFGCESKDYIENNFKIDAPFEYIGENNNLNRQDWKDMKLMSLCNHGICANSTFSWWSAWLMNNKNKIVICPTPWVRGKDDIICKDWIKINC